MFVAAQQLLAFNQDFFIILPLMPILSWVIMSGLADDDMGLDNRLLALAFA